MGETGYVPRSPDLSALDEPDPEPAPHPLSAPSYQTAYNLPPAPHSATHLPSGYAPPAARPLPSPYHQPAFHQPSPLTPLAYPPQHLPPQLQPQQQQPMAQLQQQAQAPARTPKPRARRSHSQTDEDYAPDHKPDQPDQPPARRGRKPKKPKLVAEVCDKPAPGVAEGIEVKTKFPVARIKRIMQADEDVGKVAQVTPTAVCKLIPPLVSSSRPYAQRASRDAGRVQ